MYDPDENDYESIQNQWNAEDQDILMEERFVPFSDYELNNEKQIDDYDHDEDEPPVPVYKSWGDCKAKTKRDPFLKVVKSYQKIVTNEKLKQKYKDFIEEYDMPYKFDVPFFTKDNLGKVWKDEKGQMHSAFYCLSIYPYNIYNLDPKLLIIYAPYFIKEYGFPSWYSPFVNDHHKENTYLKYIQENCDKLKLNAIETKIVQSGYDLDNHDEDYMEFDDDRWWFDGDEYVIDENGHLVEY